jgi:glutaredoxin
MMFDIEFQEEEGTNKNHNLTLFALSTCGFCRRSMKFLKEKNFAFKFVYLDKLEREKKNEIKAQLKKKFNKRAVFPYLVINEKEVITGFTQSEWEQALGL